MKILAGNAVVRSEISLRLVTEASDAVERALLFGEKLGMIDPYVMEIGDIDASQERLLSV